MATVAAGPVFRLLGARDIGVTEDYRVAKMPAYNTSLLEGELAWRQHDGGHEDRSNMSFFIAWANRLLHHTPLAPGERRTRRASTRRMADGKSIRFVDVNARLADPSGTLFEGMMVDGLHPSLKGYEVWAEPARPARSARMPPSRSSRTAWSMTHHSSRRVAASRANRTRAAAPSHPAAPDH